MAEKVCIVDVTLREYGQNVPAAGLDVFSPESRIRIASGLMDAGFTELEIFSCVSPRVSPAMNGDALRRIARGLGRRAGVTLITLVPNRRGFDRFLDLGLDPDGYDHALGIFFSAVEAHNRANLGRGIDETLEAYRPMIREAVSMGIRVYGYVSGAFGYREPGRSEIRKPDAGDLNRYVGFYLDLGVERITLSDLQGVAGEDDTSRVLEGILQNIGTPDKTLFGYHPHHVSGEKAIKNSQAAFDLGIRRFDASLGGTGGCVTGAPGNQPTEGLVRHFHGMGVETGLNERAVFELSGEMAQRIYGKIPQ